jgi:outer membrane protein OmpA-like peptidoglycan-associated protein
MDVILNAKGTPENIALKIVKQNRQLGLLSKNVGLLEKDLKATKSNLAQTEGALKSQEEALKKSSTQVKFQKAMEQAGEYFSEEEASVYQQGNKLIFRLKKINFSSGTSIIPATSKPLLSKVNDIIKPLGAEMVVVQGHTDSVGSANINKNLSIKRASSVANYLASFAGGYKIGYLGFGETRPIASNETKEGRAINRRVDLVVTAKK